MSKTVIANIRANKGAVIMKKAPIKKKTETKKDFKSVKIDGKLHGKTFKGMYKRVPIDGTFIYNSDGALYICTDVEGFDGHRIPYKFGHKYSYRLVGYSTLKDVSYVTGIEFTSVSAKAKRYEIIYDPFNNYDVFGYLATRIGNKFSFGCGDVKVRVETIEQFVELLDVATIRQINALGEVLGILDRRGIPFNAEMVKKIKSLLGK